MKYSKRSVDTYYINLESEDALYDDLRWTNIIVDSKNLSLYITNDFGTYSYEWQDIGDKTFNEFLCLLRKEYLLRKLCNKTCFNIEKNTDLIIEDLLKNYSDRVTEIEIIDIKKSIEHIDYSTSEEIFYYMVEEIISENTSIDYEINIVVDYEFGDIVTIEFFMKYFKEVIKK